MSEPMQLPDETVAVIGKKTEHRYEVSRKDIRRYVQAVGSTDSRYRDGEVAPPLFCHSLAFEDVSPDMLRADGLPAELDVPLPTARAVGGGSSFDVGVPVRPGDLITVKKEIEDIYAKSGRSGDLIFVVLTTTYVNQNNELVARERGEFVNR
jgi:hydroxyacyl-ACP dehydratase HTD2-like protein with hotdog domain